MTIKNNIQTAHVEVIVKLVAQQASESPEQFEDVTVGQVLLWIKQNMAGKVFQLVEVK